MASSSLCDNALVATYHASPGLWLCRLLSVEFCLFHTAPSAAGSGVHVLGTPRHAQPPTRHLDGRLFLALGPITTALENFPPVLHRSLRPWLNIYGTSVSLDGGLHRLSFPEKQG